MPSQINWGGLIIKNQRLYDKLNKRTYRWLEPHNYKIKFTK
jgi:hypothetical protein